MHIIVALLLITIVASLGSALVFIYRDQGQGKTRAVKALSLRVGLSFVLFALLIASQRFGWVRERLMCAKRCKGRGAPLGRRPSRVSGAFYNQ